MVALGASVAFVGTRGDRKESTADLLGQPEQGNRISPRNSKEGTAAGPRGRRISTDRASSVGKITPREELGKINKLGDIYERQRALMDLFDNLPAEDFASMADQFQEMPHYDNERGEMELLFLAWAKKDPTAALDYIDENPNTRRNRDEVLQTWAGADPAAAEKWAVEKHDGDGPNPYLAAVIQGMAPHDIAGAARLTQGMPLSRERGQAIDAMAKALLMDGTEAAFAFPDSIEDERLKGSFIMMISQNLSRKDPQAAADWLTSMDQGVLQERAAGDVAARLARLDVSKATDFVSKLQPEAKSRAAANVIPAMSESDIAGTARWVSSMAGTPGYDRMVESFVWSCDEREPEQSAAWISGIADPAQQTRLYNRMLGNWAKKDAAAVRTWVAQNEVPVTVRDRFVR